MTRDLTSPGFQTVRPIVPVWSDSAREPVAFAPLPKGQAVRLYREAKRLERDTRAPGRQDGALGRNGLAVLHALLFDFLNSKTGRCDPGAKAIALAANLSERSVWRGIAALKAAGVLHVVRRCVQVARDNCGFELRQLSNAYAFRPATQWRGHAPRSPAPSPDPESWGARPALPDAVTLAAEAKGLPAMVSALRSDPTDGLASVLAQLGFTIAAKTASFPGLPA